MDIVDDLEAYDDAQDDARIGAKEPLGEVRLFYKEIPDLTQDFQGPPNVGLISLDGVATPAHMGVLLELDFFTQYIGQETIQLDLDTDTLKNLVDLLYGKTVNFSNWMAAFDLFEFLTKMNLDWDMTNVVCAFNVRAADFDSYMMQLGEFYDGGMPDVIRKKAQRCREKNRTPPPQATGGLAQKVHVIHITVHPFREDLYLEQDHNLILRPRPDEQWECVGYLNQGEITPLTPELRLRCIGMRLVCV
jgi:hypothetical protein